MLQQYYIFLFGVILFSGQLCAAENEFGDEHKPYNFVGGWLRLHKLAATWEAAKLRCYLEGGIVATPANMQAMIKMMSEADPPVPTVFVGQPPSNLHVPWVGGEHEDQPSAEECLVMTDAAELTTCSTLNRYFCYKDNVDNEINHCGVWNKDYKLDPRTGSCYKFHMRPRSWFGAAMACRAEHAHLAVINSDTEAEVLKELFAQHPKKTPWYTDTDRYVHIGFWDWKEKGEWKTIFGQTLGEAGFETWDTNEPNHGGSNAFCGTLHRNGRLNDHSCDAKEAFICEINTYTV